jgi:hypothetical protein
MRDATDVIPTTTRDTTGTISHTTRDAATTIGTTISVCGGAPSTDPQTHRSLVLSYVIMYTRNIVRCVVVVGW